MLVDDLAVCQKLAQDLRTQLGRTESTRYDNTTIEELADCTTKRDEFDKLAQDLRTQLDNTLRMSLAK